MKFTFWKSTLAGLMTLCLAAPTAISAPAESPDLLRETGAAFSRIAEDAVDAVVFVQAERTVEVNMPQFPEPFEFFFRSPFEGRGGPQQQPRSREYRQRGQGSGFIITEDGYILTNSHVVKDAESITVTMRDGSELEAELIGADTKTEVALIKVDGKDLPVLELGDSDAIRIGEWVLAVGSPFGLTETVTAGIVSAKGRSNMGITDYEYFIQTDAAINPGNSGGPLLNIDGEVVGINTAIYSRSGGYMGIGFAVPINMAKIVKQQLIEEGEVTRSYLGVYIQPVDETLAESFGLDEARGILISQVEEGSAADEAGLEQGDIILEFNGRSVEDMGSFRNEVATTPPGTTIELRINRDGRMKKVKATLQRLEEEEMAAADTEQMVEDLGIAVTELTPEMAEELGYEDLGRGVVVERVAQGSRAWRHGIRRGHLILEVNRQPVEGVGDFKKALRQSEESGLVLLLVRGPRGTRYVPLKLED
ncbi:DegQ family serine endoprotease [Kiritimatiella glycovorans]|uniref:Probable periplasmic serine endoprotease DegP-like n=1 Tax=Kiritimatiella glycovorans TaxID=1307763 RepID=A0A0G3EF13_9BACT|nr:DegQ family serine endoprotease [Kiritimatiella glycovorans]AKJ64022.1 putative periplasmic serine endoprotease DegP-like precursor [Kiritimatiella glycovorans]